MRKNIRSLTKKGENSPIWTVVIIIIGLPFLIFLIYFAIKSGTFAKKVGGKII